MAERHHQIMEAVDTNVDDNVDVYGKGAPFDRLQFGYSPAVTSEAVAFHERMSSAKWIKRRKANYAAACLRREKLSALHFEPLTSMLKLKEHWRQVQEFQSKNQNRVSIDEAENFLKFIAQQQHIDGDRPVTAIPIQQIDESDDDEQDASALIEDDEEEKHKHLIKTPQLSVKKTPASGPLDKKKGGSKRGREEEARPSNPYADL